MAKNWTVAEATNEILNGNKEAIIDIGRRFPLATRAIAIAGENAKAILEAFSFVTVRKVESVLKDGVEINTEDDEETPEEKPVKKEKKAPVKKDEPTKKRGRKPAMNKPETAEETDEDDEDYESMSEVDLYKICKKKGLKPAPKQKKQYYLDLLNPSEEEDWDEEEEDEKPAKKTTKEAIAKKKAAKKAAEEEDDDWDI